MNVDALRRMELGQIVDYCIEWNKIHEEQENNSSDNEQAEQETRRKATQADWDALFGR